MVSFAPNKNQRKGASYSKEEVHFIYGIFRVVRVRNLWMNFTLRNIAQIALLYEGAPLIFDFLIVYWLPYILNSLLRGEGCTGIVLRVLAPETCSNINWYNLFIKRSWKLLTNNCNNWRNGRTFAHTCLFIRVFSTWQTSDVSQSEIKNHLHLNEIFYTLF